MSSKATEELLEGASPSSMVDLSVGASFITWSCRTSPVAVLALLEDRVCHRIV